VGEDGGPRWWLTQESGRLPPECGDTECGSCEWSGAEYIPGRAYIVVVLRIGGSRAEVCIAQLSKRSLASVLNGVLCLLRRGCSPCAESAARMARLLQVGGCSGAACCGCKLVGGACVRCVFRRRGRGGCEWIIRNGFTGVFPSPQHPWFTGVTDAVDVLAVREATGWRWLSCSG
jgi:hypothetical protein